MAYQRVETMTTDNIKNKTSGIEIATFGAGCFWCVEAIFQQIEGVIKVIPGYCGGTTQYPTYSEVCTGSTGHAEVCQIIYDSEVISFDELLEVFWLIHDPTSLNRQHSDVGTQFRSAIFYHNQQQKESAEEYVGFINSSLCFSNCIVTEICSFEVFYKAEKYHQNFYRLNMQQPYCIYVINPKINKFKIVFRDKLKTSCTYENN